MKLTFYGGTLAIVPIIMATSYWYYSARVMDFISRIDPSILYCLSFHIHPGQCFPRACFNRDWERYYKGVHRFIGGVWYRRGTPVLTSQNVVCGPLPMSPWSTVTNADTGDSWSTELESLGVLETACQTSNPNLLCSK